ncbi:hypothetical protein TELCIR_21888, partial [Teladorsagia circumcincta]
RILLHNERMVEWSKKARNGFVPPWRHHSQPNSKIVFNDKHTYHIKIINASGQPIGWAIETTNNGLGVDLACCALDPKEATLMAATCDVFDYQ